MDRDDYNGKMNRQQRHLDKAIVEAAAAVLDIKKAQEEHDKQLEKTEQGHEDWTISTAVESNHGGDMAVPALEAPPPPRTMPTKRGPGTPSTPDSKTSGYCGCMIGRGQPGDRQVASSSRYPRSGGNVARTEGASTNIRPRVINFDDDMRDDSPALGGGNEQEGRAPDQGQHIGSADVAEVYSRERVVPVAVRNCLKGGSSIGLTTYDRDGRPWGLSKHEMRRRAYKRVVDKDPELLIGSVMCRDFSSIMNINWPRMSPAERERRLAEARIHLNFVCSLYRLQHRRGTYYLHEHPQSASSWNEKCILDVEQAPGGIRLTVDQCQYGLHSWDKDGRWLPARKATTYLTNCAAMATTLNRWRTGEHRCREHVQLEG